jgi:ureidoglycolate hydrolase
MPDPNAVRAFLFDGSQGVCMKVGTWHEFLFPLEDDTQALVILRHETNRDLQRKVGTEAFGDDLDKKDVQDRWGRTLKVVL